MLPTRVYPTLNLPLPDIDDQRNNSLIPPRCSSALGYSEYNNRKKSASFKIIRRGEGDSCTKKAVRFADDFGLELRQMKMINTDEVPFIPNKAFKHLRVNNENTMPLQGRTKVITYMEPQFKNPMYTEGFEDCLSQQKIVLEQAGKFLILDKSLNTYPF